MRILRGDDMKMLSRKWYIATAIGCFMPPIGLLLAIINTVFDYKKLKEKNKAILRSAFAALIFSLFMTGYVVFIPLISGTIDVMFEFVIYYAMVLLLAIYMFIIYAVLSHRAKYLSQIFMLIKNDHIISVSMISEIVGINKGRTVKYLKALEKTGDLRGAVIDPARDEIEIKESVWLRQNFICSSCGAEITVVYGQTLVCPYCGGALKIKLN